jgi:exodeoxyribonuclease VII small subunit
MTTGSRIDEVGFEALLRLLEQTVEDLEGGDLGLDGALAKYEQGVQLLARCYILLDVAERRVALLTEVDEDGQPETTPFDASASVERDAPFEVDAPKVRRGAAASADGAGDPPF